MSFSMPAGFRHMCAAWSGRRVIRRVVGKSEIVKREWREVDTRHHELVDPATGWVLGYVRVHSLVNNSRDPGLPKDWEEFLAQGADHRALGKFQSLHEARRAVEAALDH
jgi:hypothetical protein